MNKLEELIKKYADKLYCGYVNANTKSKKKRIYNDLFMYSQMCHNNFFVSDNFIWEDDIKLSEFSTYDNNILKSNILINKDIYARISDTVIDSYVETNFPLYKSYIDAYREYHKLNNKQMIEIILSFLNEFDYELYKKFKEKMDSADIFIQNKDEENFYGATCEFNVLKKSLMFINTENDGEYNIRIGATIMHEFGHSFEMNLYHTSGIQNNMQLYPFHEVSSQFFEYAFIEYLLSNKIHVSDAKVFRRLSLIELFYFVAGMNIFRDIEKISKDEYNVDYNLTEEKENKIKEKVNYYGAENYDFDDFDRCYIYGLGHLFSSYLYENYKKDPKYFMKEFKNALLTYPYTNSINAFKLVGVDIDALIKGDTLRRVLKNSK